MAAVLVAVAIALLSYSPSKEAVDSPEADRPDDRLQHHIQVTDISIKRSLLFLDSYNFMIYYNFIVGVLSSASSLCQEKRTARALNGGDLRLSLYSAVALVAATLLFTIMLKISSGVVIPTFCSRPGRFHCPYNRALSHRGAQC